MPNYRFVTYLAPALFLGLLFFSCTKKDEATPAPESASAVSPDIRVVATVNGDPITLAEFQERLARAGFKSGKEVELQVKEELLNRLVERKMLLREAQRRRIKIGLPDINKRIDSFRAEQGGQEVKEVLARQSIDFEKWKNDVWEDLMIERLLARDVNKNVAVSGAEVRKYYQNNPLQFDRPEQVRVRQIVVSTEEEARQVLEQLQNNPDFAAIARERSTAPEAEQGGDLGYFSRGDMPAEFNIVFTLPKGGISGVVKSPYGFHIFKLESKRPAGPLGFEEASAAIREKLTHDKQDRRYQQWLKELRSRTKFEVNYQALVQEQPSGTALSEK